MAAAFILFGPNLMRTFMILLGVVLSLGLAPVQAAQIWLDENTVPGMSIIHIRGEIEEGDAKRYIHTAAQASHRHIALVSLDSPGGDLIVAESIAIYGFDDHGGRPTTVVVPGATCASACTVLLFSGSRKIVFTGARVGVHSVEEPTASIIASRGYTTDMARELAERGLAPDVVGRLVTTPSKDMYWLTADELKRSGVSIETAPQ